MTWLRTHPRLADALLAAALVVLVGQEVLFSDQTVPVELAAPLTFVQMAALAWRRSAPLAACTVSMLALAALGLADNSELPPQTPLVGTAIAVYSVAAHASQRQALAGLAIVLAAVFAVEPGDVIVQWPLYAAVWAAGRVTLRQRRQAEDLAEHARVAIAEERARIARELHDVVAHSVSTIVVQAGAERLAVQAGRNNGTEDVLAGIERTGREALGEMRRLLGMLRRDDEEIALAPQPSLRHVAALVRRTQAAGLPVDVVVEGERVRLPPGVDVSAFRIVQEALTNALKHSGASRAHVVLRYEPDGLEVEVADDGTGGTTGDGTGHGLVGMRERVAVYGGELEAGPADAGGWRLRARLPLRGAA